MTGNDNRESTRWSPSGRHIESTRQAGPSPSVPLGARTAMSVHQRLRDRGTGRRRVVRLPRPRPSRRRAARWADRAGRRPPALGTPAFGRRPDPR